MATPASRLPVTLLTRTECARCGQARELLDRLAAEYPLAITTLDVTQPDGLAFAVRTGAMFTPSLVIGTSVVSGRISERRMREAVERGLAEQCGATLPSARWSRRGRSLLGWLARGW